MILLCLLFLQHGVAQQDFGRYIGQDQSGVNVGGERVDDRHMVSAAANIGHPRCDHTEQRDFRLPNLRQFNSLAEGIAEGRYDPLASVESYYAERASETRISSSSVSRDCADYNDDIGQNVALDSNSRRVEPTAHIEQSDKHLLTVDEMYDHAPTDTDFGAKQDAESPQRLWDTRGSNDDQEVAHENLQLIDSKEHNLTSSSHALAEVMSNSFNVPDIESAMIEVKQQDSSCVPKQSRKTYADTVADSYKKDEELHEATVNKDVRRKVTRKWEGQSVSLYQKQYLQLSAEGGVQRTVDVSLNKNELNLSLVEGLSQATNNKSLEGKIIDLNLSPSTNSGKKAKKGRRRVADMLVEQHADRFRGETELEVDSRFQSVENEFANTDGNPSQKGL